MARDPTGRGLDIQLDKFVMILSHGQIQWIGLNEDLSADAVIVASSEIMSRGFNIDECLAKAKEVFNRSHSPYSANSAIGVAIATDRGIITGCTGQDHWEIFTMFNKCLKSFVYSDLLKQSKIVHIPILYAESGESHMQ